MHKIVKIPLILILVFSSSAALSESSIWDKFFGIFKESPPKTIKANGKNCSPLEVLESLTKEPAGNRITRTTKAKAKKTKKPKKSFDRNLGELKIKKDVNGRPVLTKKTSTVSPKVGSKFLDALKPHGDMNSTTAFRFEEKIVTSKEDIKNFLEQTQAKALKGEGGVEVTPKWVLRDQKPTGKEAKTITEYGKSLSYVDPKTGTQVGLRPRFRKYYNYDEIGDADALKASTSVFDDLTVFELKTGGMGGFKKLTKKSKAGKDKVVEVPLALETAVFKPRIFVTDEIADRLKRLDASKKGYLKELDSIEKEILALRDKKGAPLNEPDKVSSMMEASRILLKKEAQLFKPDTVVAYNRTSYKYKDGSSEYQFTVDDNVAVYNAKKGRKSSEMKDYMSDKPLHAMKEDQLFAELKTPIPAKKMDGDNKVYNTFADNLLPRHNDKFDLQRGKYHLANKKRAKANRKKPIKSKAFKHGKKFWLVRSTANLPGTPKIKALVQQGIIQVAVPFKLGKGKMGRAVFEYRKNTEVDATDVTSVLNKVSFYGPRGHKIKVEDGFDEIFRKAEDVETDTPLYFMVNGQKVEFLPNINAEDTAYYKKMIDDFVYDAGKGEALPRELSELAKLNDSKDLKNLERKVKLLYKPRNWMANRMLKVSFEGLFMAGFSVAGVTAAGYYALNNTDTGQEIKNKYFGSDGVSPLTKIAPVIRLNDGETKETVDLTMMESEDGGYVFLIPKEKQADYNEDTTFYDNEGNPIKLGIRIHQKTGEKYFFLKDRIKDEE